jgi:hypothetical protein
LLRLNEMIGSVLQRVRGVILLIELRMPASKVQPVPRIPICTSSSCNKN